MNSRLHALPDQTSVEFSVPSCRMAFTEAARITGVTRIMRKSTAIVIWAVFMASSSTPLQAQSSPRYRPQRDTTSPYLNLLRDDSGPLPNYFSLVRPQLNQQATNYQNNAASSLQNLSIQRLEDFAESRKSGPTGSGSVFGDRSHFYRTRKPMTRRR